jgi:protein YIPF5/7
VENELSRVSSGAIGYVLSIMSVFWCTYAASGIFVGVLKMSDQRLLVAYPLGLLYGCFAMLSVFSVGNGALVK